MLAAHSSYKAYSIDKQCCPFAFSCPSLALDDNLPSKPPMIGGAVMLIKKADVKEYLAAKRRKYHSALGIESAVSASSFRPFGSSIKATPAPAEAVVSVSTSKSSQ
jgi:hypothetical protein